MSLLRIGTCYLGRAFISHPAVSSFRSFSKRATNAVPGGPARGSRGDLTLIIAQVSTGDNAPRPRNYASPSAPPSRGPRPYGGGGGGGGRGGGGGGGGRYGNRQPYQKRNTVPMNEDIRFPEVRLMDEAKQPLGVVAISEALDMAKKADVDLILVVPDASPPVCRLIDFSKYNYELEKAAKDAKKKQREAQIEIKELKLRPATDIHDYQVKVRAASKFLLKGARVKLVVQFKGREMEFKDIGREMFNRFLDDLGGTDEVSVEQPAQMQGRQMIMVIGPKKEQ
jgi:translation initiation factor IF-3